MKAKWEYKPLGDVGTVVGGSTPKTNILEYWNGDNYWVTPAELKGDKYIDSTERTISDIAVAKTNLTLLPAGTVLLSSRAPIGKVCITRSPMYCNQGFKNIICSEKLYNEYLYWWLKGRTSYLNSLGVGATFKEISKRVVEQIVVPVPPLDEQQRIVAELDLLTEVIDKRRMQLTELDTLAQSIFYDMFGDPIENEKGWKLSKYGDEFSIGSGGTPSKAVPDYWDGGDIPWIGSNMCQDCMIYDNDGKYITSEGLNHSSAKVLKPGTVLIALVGATIGKVGLLYKEMATNQNIAYVNVADVKNFNSVYVFFHTMALYELFMNLGNGNFKMANLSFVRSLPIILPPLTLQQEFADKIQSIEKQKAAVNQSIVETQKLLDYTMDKYFG